MVGSWTRRRQQWTRVPSPVPRAVPNGSLGLGGVAGPTSSRVSALSSSPHTPINTAWGRLEKHAQVPVWFFFLHEANHLFIHPYVFIPECPLYCRHLQM